MKTGFEPDGCTPGDFRSIFASCSGDFHWLCFTLTGDEQRARASIAAALEESVASAGLVFHERMTKWARRLLLKSCITAMRAEIGTAAGSFVTSERPPLRTGFPGELPMPAHATLRNLLPRLDIVSRFVFVLRALEACSRRETALLLDISDSACALAYARACAVIHSAAEGPGEIMHGAALYASSPASLPELQVR